MPKPTTALPDTEVKPDLLSEKRTRRTFKQDYKLNLIRKADACQHGELGALLRKEYSGPWNELLSNLVFRVLIKRRPCLILSPHYHP